MAVFYLDSGSISDLVVSNSLRATGSLFGTASYGVNASSANAGNLVVAAGGSTNTVSQLVLSNANGVSFGLDGSTLTATAGGGGGFTYNYFNPQDAYIQANGTLGSNTLYIQPMQCPNVQFDRVAIPIYISHASNSSFAATLSYYWGAYTRNASTLSLLTDVSVAFGSQLSFSSTNSSLYHGIRLWTAGITNTLTEGQYYIGFMSRITTAGNAQSISNMLASQQASSFSGIFGAAFNTTNQYTRGLGKYTATTSDLPTAIPFTDIQGGGSSQYLRQPLFYVVSQTF